MLVVRWSAPGYVHHVSVCLLTGADVTHPGPDSMEPSIAGVVGSTNLHGLGYAAEFALQPGGQEIIQELDVLTAVNLIRA